MKKSKDLELALQQVYEALSIMKNQALESTLEAAKLGKSSDVLNLVNEANAISQKISDIANLFRFDREAEMAQLKTVYSTVVVDKFYSGFVAWPGREAEELEDADFNTDIFSSFEIFLSHCIEVE